MNPAALPLAAYLIFLPPAAQPGVTNPAVTQANIHSTICVAGWTKTIRPPASYTNKLKRSQLPAGSNLSDWEEDHLISLELGGSPTDPGNLWPEKWVATYGAHTKDHVENCLHKLVCTDKLSLDEAQHAIASNWIAAGQKYCGIK